MFHVFFFRMEFPWPSSMAVEQFSISCTHKFSKNRRRWDRRRQSVRLEAQKKDKFYDWIWSWFIGTVFQFKLNRIRSTMLCAPKQISGNHRFGRKNLRTPNNVGFSLCSNLESVDVRSLAKIIKFSWAERHPWNICTVNNLTCDWHRRYGTPTRTRFYRGLHASWCRTPLRHKFLIWF